MSALGIQSVLGSDYLDAAAKLSSKSSEGSGFAAILEKRKEADQVPYGELAKNGVIQYKGVVFNCDAEHNCITLGDVSNSKDVISVPLSGGGTFKFNRNNIDELSKAISMFSPEDINLIMRAIATDKKIRETEQKIDDMTHELGTNDSNEENKE